MLSSQQQKNQTNQQQRQEKIHQSKTQCRRESSRIPQEPEEWHKLNQQLPTYHLHNLTAQKRMPNRDSTRPEMLKLRQQRRTATTVTKGQTTKETNVYRNKAEYSWSQSWRGSRPARAAEQHTEQAKDTQTTTASSTPTAGHQGAYDNANYHPGIGSTQLAQTDPTTSPPQPTLDH
jgi:hypothetical protein